MTQPLDINALTQKALKQVRTLARGNGAEADAIQIQKTDGEIIQCEAITHLELHPDISTEQKKGEQNIGQALPDASAIEQAIQAHIKDASKNSEMRKLMANFLLERPDKGFAIHGEYFDLPPLKKIYSTYIACGTCGGQGRTNCGRCNGQRQEVCNVCRGRGLVPCTYCHGSGHQQGPNGQPKQCTYCHGQRQISCHTCQKRGQISCRQCKGTGSTSCHTCKGMGAFTQVTTVNIQMKTLFEIDRASLPHPAVKMIETKGSKIVTGKEITVSGEQVKREDGGLAIQYNLSFPYILMMISVNGKPYKMELFGTKGRIIKLPALIETMTGTQVALLEQSARGEGAVQSNVIKASKTRIIGEALALTLTLPQKKAMLALKKKYPMGISNDGLKNLIKTSHYAIRQLTKKARYSGYAMAAIMNAALYGAYFFALRDMILPVAGQNGAMILDFALIPLGGFIGSLITKFIARRPLQKALGHLIKNPQSRKLGVLQNYAISFGAYILVLLILKYTGQSLPSWFNF